MGEYAQLVISNPTKSDILIIYLQEWNSFYMIRNQELLQISYLHNFLIFYETHFNAKIEHEDNFFIELDSRLFWPTKITSPSWESIPRSNMSGPPPRATIFAGLARLSCKHDTVNYTPISCCTYSYSPFNRGGPGFSCAHPSIKTFHRFLSLIFFNHT